MANTTIKITQLQNIGNGLAGNTLLPVVNTTGTAITQKVTVGNVANFVLGQAGNTLAPAFLSTLAYSVVNAAQPNITSVGTLSINTLKISGGTNGYVIQTDGSGNLSWTAQTGNAGNGTPGGSNTQVQFNDSGAFGGNTGFTFNKTTGIFTSPFLAGNGNGLSNIQGANVSGLGNIATANFDGNTSNVLHGDGTWSADQTTYGNSNVVTLLSAFGSNTITTTGNISGGNLVTGGQVVASGNVSSGTGLTTGGFLSVDGNTDLHNTIVTGNLSATGNITASYVLGNGSQLTNIAGANVSGFVPNANVANTAFAVAAANVIGLGNIATLSLSGSTSNVLYGNGVFAAVPAPTVAQDITSNGAMSIMLYDGNIKYNNYATVEPSSGNIAGGNISANGNISGNNISATGNITANNLGNISSINIDGSNSNVLYGNGVFAAAAGGNANTGNVTFNDINIIGTGNLKLQPDSANASAYLDIFLTAGPDIHIAGGSGYSGAVILGTDEEANVAILPGGNVAIQAGNVSGTQTWNFGTDGTTTFPTANIDLHNGGVQSAEVLQFGNPNLQSIITGPTPAADTNAQRIIIQGQRGNGTGEGGDVYVWGGDADTNGGDIKIYAGDADNVSAGSGGYINLAGGDGFDFGGDITLNGGTSANGYGGIVNITGGSGGFDGGSARLQGGYGANGQGGAVEIAGGEGNSQATYGNVEIGIGTYAWLFDNTGNVRLPGNTFAVNYANGTQVSISGGNANTGNVTFSDQVVMGTGSNDGTGGLYLAPGNASIANSAVQYLRVRGGDVATHIHLDTGNNQFYDQYFGADSRFVKLEANGNVVINADDYNGNGATWTLDTTGNLTLAGGNSVIQSIANSSLDILNPNVSTMRLTPDANYNSQALVLDPTLVGHIHLRSPGSNIDQPSANLFLGGEVSSFEVGQFNGAVPNLFIHSNNNTWMFDIDGNITFPRDASNISTDPYLKILGGPSPQILSEDASLAGPANLAIVTDYLNLSGSTGNKIVAYPDQGLLGADANLVLFADFANVGNTNSYWTFDTTGNLTLPGNLVIAGNTSVFGTDASLLQTTDNRPLLSVSSGSNGGVSSLWVEDIGNVGTSNIAAVYANPTSGSGIVRIAVGQNGGNAGPNLWDFNASGVLTLPQGSQISETSNTSVNITANANTWAFGVNGTLTLPGNTFAVNYANGTQVPVGVTQDITSNGAMSIMTYDGNLKYVNYATVEPSTGNIAGGNISTTGAVTANTANITTGNITTINSGLLQNGNSNITITSNGNVSIQSAGSTVELVVTSTGANITGTLSVTGNTTVGALTASSMNLTSTQIALGAQAGLTSQGGNAVAIGRGAGSNTQAAQSIAIGQNSGNLSQGAQSIAIGVAAGANSQGQGSIAMGRVSGQINQGNFAIAIGESAANNSQGDYAIALGAFAGNSNQANNSIVINATVGNIENTTANSLVIAPVRNDVSNIAQVMFYNTTSKEVTYGNTISVAGNITGGNIIGNGNTLSNVATKTSGSWTLASGVNTVSISVPLNGTYTIWINGNIPNGIITYTATAVVTNTNVPVLGSQYAWYYSVGNALVFTTIPDQFTGTVGSISTVNTYAGNTANVFTFGITNNSGNTAVVNYGYTKL
jgi:hypothetical protein